jgi:hypothetical protein
MTPGSPARLRSSAPVKLIRGVQGYHLLFTGNLEILGRTSRSAAVSRVVWLFNGRLEVQNAKHENRPLH